MTIPYKIRVKPVTTPPKTPDTPQGRDTFETPNYAVDLLIPFIPKDVRTVWECACGSGKIVRRLESKGYRVVSTDIRDFGFNHIWNFLEDTGEQFDEDIGYTHSAIITNPPFSIKSEFIERAFEYKIPFAFLINADYSGQSIKWVEEYKCEKIIPKRRVAYITPNIVNRVNEGEETNYLTKDEIPSIMVYKYSSSQFHSMWLTHRFGLGQTETFVDLPIKELKENI